MRDSQIPSFYSEDLQKAVADARPVLEGVDETRNRVSNDIKAVEAYLKSLDLKWSFRFSLGEGFTAERGTEQSEWEFRASLEEGSASAECTEEALLWDKDITSKEFRLLYEIKRWEGYLEVDAPGVPWFRIDDTLQREIKPLIETKFEIRKRMYQHLPDFVTALAAHFDVGVRQRIRSDDVPL